MAHFLICLIFFENNNEEKKFFKKIKYINMSDATVWKFESLFGFRFFSFQNRNFSFRFSEEKKAFFV